MRSSTIAALFVEELRVALPARREIEDVGGAERLEKGRRGPVVRPLDQRLAHVRDVEQARRLAGVQVLGEDAGRVLDRHVVAGERRHARAEFDVQRMQGRLEDDVVAHGSTDRVQDAARSAPQAERRTIRMQRPLCRAT